MRAFFSSKTIWTQIIGFAAMLAAMFGIDVAPEDQATVATSIMGAVNAVGIVVRYMTTKPMSDKSKSTA
jgi:uncharacterized membrane protein